MNRFGVGLIISVVLPALFYSDTAFAQTSPPCAADQRIHVTYTPTGVIRTIPVLGSAGGVDSGLPVRQGFAVRMTATGSIRVGVFGETGTPPEGWVPQGPAGNGYPAPGDYTFSLLYRMGPAAQWKMLGTGPTLVKLGPKDPAVVPIQFGINDTRLNDNSGAFVVTMTELSVTQTCVANTPISIAPGFNAIGRAGKPSSPKGGGGGGAANLPCEGKTADGQRQVFQFPLYCGGNFSRNIPIEACTRAEALPQAQAFARSAPPNCVLAP